MRVSPASSGRVVLRDGRVLGYASFGPPGGIPVLYFHGLAGTPLGRSAVTEAVLERGGVRWLCVQRPGFGISDPSPGRRIRDWPLDVLELLDTLGIERAHMIGVSAGAPYAFAAAGALRERVTSVGVVSALGPPDAHRRRRLARALIRLPIGCLCGSADRLVGTQRRRPWAFRVISASAPVGRSQSSRDAVLAALLASAQRGTRPIAEELRLVLSPWELELTAVRCPVVLFHGARDRLVPCEDAARLALALPDSTIRTYPDEGHFFFRRRMGEILAAVLATEGARTRDKTSPPVTGPSGEPLGGAVLTALTR